MAVTGPDSVALQVRDLDRAAEFYEARLGLRRTPSNPPGAVVFDTTLIPFAVREPLPDVDLAPFGRAFAFLDPDGYAVTVHDGA